MINSPHVATTPGHALLNYLYALLEAEARLACLAVGLDPGLGVFHADLRARASLACDLMEAVRPDIDRWLLGVLEKRTFTARDFFETREGQCRVLPPLTATLAETLPMWRRAIAPVAEWAAQRLMDSALPISAPWVLPGAAMPGDTPAASQPLPTVLTNAKRSAARPANKGAARELKGAPVSLPKTCPQCGEAIGGGRAVFCGDGCRDIYTREVNRPAFQAAGPAALAERRAAGDNPNGTAAARAKVGATQRERAAARAVWEREHAGEVFDPDYFRSRVVLGLQGVPLSILMQATGLSVRYCSLIRRGEHVPHPMYWQPLAAIKKH